MARIRWHGSEHEAEPIQELPNGNWLMKAQEHGARFAIGTLIEVKPGEIVTMDKGTPNPAATPAALEVAMAEERKTLPSVRELLMKRAANEAKQAAAKA